MGIDKLLLPYYERKSTLAAINRVLKPEGVVVAVTEKDDPYSLEKITFSQDKSKLRTSSMSFRLALSEPIAGCTNTGLMVNTYLRETGPWLDLKPPIDVVV